MHIMTKSQNSIQRKISRSCSKSWVSPYEHRAAAHETMYRLSRTVSIPIAIYDLQWREEALHRSGDRFSIRYLMLNEFYWNIGNHEKEYQSSISYKDLGGKLPLSDRYGIWTGLSNSWWECRRDQQLPGMDGRDKIGRSIQANSWYKTLIGDPYFVTKLYECQAKRKPSEFWGHCKDRRYPGSAERISAGTGNATNQAGYLMHRSTFESEVERLQTWRTVWTDGSAVHSV